MVPSIREPDCFASYSRAEDWNACCARAMGYEVEDWSMVDVVEEGVTGHFFDLAPDRIAQVLQGLEKPALHVMSAACLDRVATRFSPARYGREMNALFADLTDAPKTDAVAQNRA